MATRLFIRSLKEEHSIDAVYRHCDGYSFYQDNKWKVF
jgi:hypothetical protein